MKNLLILLAMAMLAGTALGAIQNLSTSIVVTEVPYTLSFSVLNESDTNKQLGVEISAPSRVEFIDKPASIKAHSSARVVAKIYPKSGLEGSTYIGNVKVNLGGDITEKKITIEYFSTNDCTVKITAQYWDNSVHLTLENPSSKPKEVSFTGATGLPSNWEIASDKFSLSAFETKQAVLATKEGDDFNGTAQLNFECQDKTITQDITIRHKKATAPIAPQADTNSDLNVSSTGLALLGSGLDLSLMLNIFLALAASVLLIAFIARLVKFFSKGAQK